MPMGAMGGMGGEGGGDIERGSSQWNTSGDLFEDDRAYVDGTIGED